MLCFESFRRFFILIGKSNDFFVFSPFSASVSSLLSKRNPFGVTFLKIVSSSIYGVWWRHNHLSTSSSRLLCATLLCLWCRCVAEAINKCRLIASSIAKTATIAIAVSNSVALRYTSSFTGVGYCLCLSCFISWGIGFLVVVRQKK